MRRIVKLSEFGIVLLTLVSFAGCGGGGDSAAPTGDPAAATSGGALPGDAMPGDTMIADAGTGAAPGTRSAAAALPENGMPGDDYAAAGPDGAAVITDDTGVSTPGIFPGDAGGLPGDVANPGGFPGDASGFGQAPPKDPAPPEDADLLTKANYAFAIGKESIAHQYLFAHILCNDAAAKELLSEFRWLWAAKRPVATTRFGVGVILSAPSNLTDYKPIGTPQLSGNAGGGSGMDMGMGGGAPGAKASPNTRAFRDLTGDFGEAVVAAFESRWTNGDFGTIFNEVTAIQPVVGGPGGMAGFGDAAGFPGGDVAMPGGFQGGDPNAGSPGSNRPRALPGKSITPGLHYLGVGSQGELADKAAKEGLHAVFYFDVECKPNRMGVIQNDTRVRLVTVGTNKVVAATSTLNNVKVERASMTGDGNDVEKQVTSLMKRLEAAKKPDGKEDRDIATKLVDLPTIAPNSAAAQVKRIVDSKPKDILAALVEIRLYHAKGLVSDDDRTAAFQLLLESAGATLVSGSEEERVAALKSKLASYK